jgi:hypothetical protein
VSSCRAERSINSSKTRRSDGDIGGSLRRRSGVGFALAFRMQVRDVFSRGRFAEEWVAFAGGGRVLSLGKLGAGQQRYYMEAVASGVEDYYSGRGEVTGRWVGAGAETLALSGVVDGDGLRAVLEGRDPETGVPLGRVRSDHVPGFDLTFRAPKSVSVLFGLCGFEVSAQVRSAHDTAVDEALGYLERAACWSRRGTDGVHQDSGGGFVGAASCTRLNRLQVIRRGRRASGSRRRCRSQGLRRGRALYLR